jgi:chitin deacetylase
MLVGAQTLRKYTGVRTKWFRAPGGGLSPTVIAEARKLHEDVVGWGIDTGDWRRPPAWRIVSRVLNNAESGAVVLMHDGGGDRSATIAALPTVIRKLRARGYRFVTLDDMAAAGVHPQR